MSQWKGRCALIDSPLKERLADRSTAGLILSSMRPLQWSKNSIVFAGLIFGQKMLQFGACARATMAFAIFCALSGSVYLVNDVLDRDRDFIHPEKRNRPIASGLLEPTTALMVAACVATLSLALSACLGWSFFRCCLTYVLLMAFYSSWLKRIVLLDSLAISAGFVLRAAAGAYAVDVTISRWLLACTVVAACFLAFCKRRAELDLLAEEAERHRQNLSQYSVGLLDQLITVCASATIVCYLLYALSPDTAAKFHTNAIYLTFFPVLYGVMRYMALSRESTGVGRPERVLLTDGPILAAVACWVVLVVLIVYLKL